MTARQILTDPLLFLAFGFGSGLSKKAPGTLGTLAAVPLYGLFSQLGFVYYSGLLMLVIISGFRICGAAADKLGEHDYGGIVWDEVAGLLVTLWWAPVTWQSLVLGFVLFRLFDIIKPWPIRWVDRQVSGGFGIMLDDILAGLLAALVLAMITGSGWL